jgi:transglutaminase-like putative cysteine protease
MTVRRRLTVGFVATNTVLIWLSTAVASTALWATYRSIQLVVLVVVATVAGSAIAILGARFRWSALVTLAVTIVTYLAIGVPLAVPGRALFLVLPSGQGMLDLLTGTALSWKQLLTITLPVGSYQALLVPALVLVLGTVTAGLTIALRAPWGEVGAFAPAVLFIVAILFGSGSPSFPVPSALGLLALLLLWLVWWRWFRRRESIRRLSSQALDENGRPLETAPDNAFVGFRTLLSAAVILAIAGSAAVVVSAVLPPTNQRTVLRTAIQQPFDPRDYPSPLSGFRHYEEPATANETVLSVTGLPKGGRIRIATMDTYDGIVYSVGTASVSSESGSFTRVPYTFDQASVTGKKVSIGVTIGDYTGVWVPTIGAFESIQFTGAHASSLRDAFYYNNTSGTAAVLTPLSSGDHYTITAVEPVQPSASRLAALRPGTAIVPPIGVLPAQLSSTLDDWTKGSTSAGKKLVAMLAAIKKNGYVSHGVSSTEPASRSGHAADRITQLLTDQRMIGDQEQYAVTAALMARQLGFPARVVFGFAPTTVDPSGTTTITGDEVSAWIEVDTADYGWVTIDPTPAIRPIPEEQPQVPTKIVRPQTPVIPPVTEPDTSNVQSPPDDKQDQPTTLPVWLTILLRVLVVLGWVVLGAAILLSPFLVIVVAKLRRRRLRLRAPTPIERISGGWDEYEDAAVDHGFDPPTAATRTEVAVVIGGMRPLVLASIADRAIFAPGDPDDGEADNVWHSVGELVAALDEGSTRWERIRAAVSLRSLGGYSVRKLFKR